MTNSMLTINMITREAVRLWQNTNAFLMHIDMQYDDSFAQTGAKIGQALRIRLPNDFVVRTGAAASPQDTAEQSLSLVVATQQGVDLSFSSVDRAMSLDDYSKRILAPSINNLAGAVAFNIMNGVEGGICNYVANVDSAANNNVLNPVAATYLTAGAILNINSAPLGNRKIVNDPFTEARMLDSLKGLFNPAPKISTQFNTGRMQEALGFDWMQDQTVIKHTNGGLWPSPGATGNASTASVNGAGQVGTLLVVNALPAALVAGDIITIAGVNSVNRITKGTNGTLRQFVVTAAAAQGATQVSIYPALIPPTNSTPYGGLPYTPAQYQTVTASPINGAIINLVSGSSGSNGSTTTLQTYRKNFVYTPEAVTMATADLELYKGVHEAAREVFNGLSIRMLTDYMVGTDQAITRLDILYGYVWVRPEWAVVVADAL